MGSKHRHKSKPARRNHAQPEATAIAQAHPIPPHDGGAKGEAALVPVAGVQPTTSETQKGDADTKDDPAPTDGGEDVVANKAHASDGVTTTNEEADPPPLSPQEARQVLERLFVAMLAAGMSPTQVSTCADPVVLTTIEEELETQDRDNTMELSVIQRCAIRVVTTANDGSVRVAALRELASAVTFRVEMLEFQIRQAILDRAGTKSRGKVDVQRVLAKIASSLPGDAEHITAKQFESLLEEKLGVTAGSSMLSKVVFARIVGHQFVHTLPKILTSARSAFFTALDTFVVDKPLSLDSVEGQLRHLVANHADLSASFRALDTDGSGSISLDEFVAFLQREAHMHYPRGVLAAFIRRFDLDGDGSLSYDEFVAFVSPKQFGIQVLTPFGMFYQATDRHELMGDVVAKIKTRMFWMQHNDLFATSTQPVYKPPLKLKVTDHFILTHHYGTLRLQYKASDSIAKVLKNGEMVVLVQEPGVNSTINTSIEQLPPFEYRLKPNVKRSIPLLLSWSLRDIPGDQTAPTKPAAPPKLTIKARRLNRDSNAAAGNTFGDDDGTSVQAAADLPCAIEAVALSPQASSSSYEFYELDHLTDEDEDYPESRGEDSERENEDAFGHDSAAGDESGPPGSVFCVEDANGDWDEDAPPPPYDG